MNSTGNNTIQRAASKLNNKIKARRVSNNAGDNIRNTGVGSAQNMSNSYFGSRQTIITMLATLLVIIVLVASGRWLWRYHRDQQSVTVNTMTLLDGANTGDNEFTISKNNMPPSTYSNEYALSFWVYVDDYNYRRDQDKFILRRGRISHDSVVNPEVRLLPFHNTLEVTVSLQTDKSPSHASQNHHPDCPASPEGFASCVSASNTGASNMDNLSVHPTKALGDDYFATMDGQHLVPDPGSGKKRGLALARLHQDHSERFQDNADSSTATAIPTEEGDVQTTNATNSTNASNTTTTPACEECECTCGAPPDELSRDEWRKTTAKCMVPDFPLQKWVHVVVSQYNQVMDVYVDGHLASSCPLPGFPAISTENLVLCPDGGFSGRVARVTYSNTSLSASEVQEVYGDGPDSEYKPIRQQVPTWAVVTVIIAMLLLVALIVV